MRLLITLSELSLHACKPVKTRSSSLKHGQHAYWAGPSWSSYALQVRSLLLHGFHPTPLFGILYKRRRRFSSHFMLLYYGHVNILVTGACLNCG
jgi:hypothetical protein